MSAIRAENSAEDGARPRSNDVTAIVLAVVLAVIAVLGYITYSSAPADRADHERPVIQD